MVGFGPISDANLEKRNGGVRPDVVSQVVQVIRSRFSHKHSTERPNQTCEVERCVADMTAHVEHDRAGIDEAAVERHRISFAVSPSKPISPVGECMQADPLVGEMVGDLDVTWIQVRKAFRASR